MGRGCFNGQDPLRHGIFPSLLEATIPNLLEGQRNMLNISQTGEFPTFTLNISCIYCV